VNLESRFDPAERREDCATSEIELDKTVDVLIPLLVGSSEQFTSFELTKSNPQKEK
jgi:hypothetical protein